MDIEIEPDLAPVLSLPVKPGDNDSGRVLTQVHSYQCQHRRFTIDEKLHDKSDRRRENVIRA